MSLITTTECRVCPDHVVLDPVLHLGPNAPSTFLDPDEQAPLPDTPLDLARCPECTLVQLRHTLPAELLFRQYWYQSGINEVMWRELGDVVTAACARVRVNAADLVLDIGANDGTLLSTYSGIRPTRLAFEPAQNLQAALERHTDKIFPDFFPPKTNQGLIPVKYKHIFAIAMFYDLDDPNAFVHVVKQLLHPDGVFIVQLQDLAGMLETTAFDCICHEHVEYYSLYALERTLKHNALKVYDVEPRAINGGSIRCYIGHAERQPPWAARATGVGRVLAQLSREDKMGLHDADMIALRFQQFGRRIARVRETLQALVAAAHHLGQPVDGYGASTKGNTLLQVCGLDATKIRQIAERSPAKVGKVTVATRIPIVSEEAWRQDPAPVTLVPIWQFREAVLEREAAYLQGGGQFLFPLPQGELVRG